jgi:hypothetical protein
MDGSCGSQAEHQESDFLRSDCGDDRVLLIVRGVDINAPEHCCVDDHHSSTTILTIPIGFQIVRTIDTEFDRAGVAAVRHAITRMNLLARLYVS